MESKKGIPFIIIDLDKPRKLRFGMRTMVEFEQLSGKKLQEVTEDMSVTESAMLLCAMLKKELPDLTLDEACDLIDDNVSNIEEFNKKLFDAIALAFPEANPKNVKQPKK